MNAFTLVEISITMLLSLIIIGTLYMAFRIVTRQVEQPEDKRMEDIAVFKMTLEHAFFSSAQIAYVSSEKTLTCSDSSLVRQFLMKPEAVIMKTSENLLDTIFRGIYEFQVLKEKDDLIEEIEYLFPVQGDTLSICLKKEYSLSSLMNHKQVNFEY